MLESKGLSQEDYTFDRELNSKEYFLKINKNVVNIEDVLLEVEKLKNIENVNRREQIC